MRFELLYLYVQDYRRRYNLEPLVKSIVDKELGKQRQRATVSMCIIAHVKFWFKFDA